jgi:hypothetical protein
MATQPPRSGGPKPGGKPPTAFQIWFEDAWAGWLKHVSLILLAALLFVLYQLDLLNERALGLIIGLGVPIGALVIAATPAREHIKTPGQRFALYAICALWAGCAVYPILYGLFPGEPYAKGELADEGSQVTLQAPGGGKAVYVSGKLRGGGGDVNATFKIAGNWEGGSHTVEGSLSRVIVTGRVGRRGVTHGSAEFNERRLYLGRTTGPVTLRMEQKDEAIDKNVSVELLRAPVPPMIIMILSIVVFGAALGLDRVLDPKGRTSLGVAAAISLTFSIYYGFEQVSRHNLVKPAIGSIFFAIIVGGIGGWIVAWVVKKMTPEKKKRPARA